VNPTFGHPPFEGCEDPDCTECGSIRLGRSLVDTLEGLEHHTFEAWLAMRGLKRAIWAAVLTVWAMFGALVGAVLSVR